MHLHLRQQGVHARARRDFTTDSTRPFKAAVKALVAFSRVTAALLPETSRRASIDAVRAAGGWVSAGTLALPPLQCTGAETPVPHAPDRTGRRSRRTTAGADHSTRWPARPGYVASPGCAQVCRWRRAGVNAPLQLLEPRAGYLPRRCFRALPPPPCHSPRPRSVLCNPCLLDAQRWSRIADRSARDRA